MFNVKVRRKITNISRYRQNNGVIINVCVCFFFWFETVIPARPLAGMILFRLQVGILAGDVVDAGTGLLRVQVVMTYDEGAGITPVKVFKQPSHGSLLFRGTRVGGLTADVEPALVADADRVGVVVLAVGADHPFGSSGLNLSVTTDDVVVADAELPALLAVP